MFKTAALISTAALTVAAFASPAMAQSFSPANHGAATLSGVLNLQQTQNINCQTDVDVNISGGAATVTGRSFGPGPHWTCGWIVTPLGSWTVTAGGAVDPVNLPGKYYVSASVGAQSIAGTCFGTVTGIYDNGAHTLTFDNEQIPSTDPQDCFVTGTLTDSTLTVIVVP
jgi:hypothetical protein